MGGERHTDVRPPVYRAGSDTQSGKLTAEREWEWVEELLREKE